MSVVLPAGCSQPATAPKQAEKEDFEQLPAKKKPEESKLEKTWATGEEISVPADVAAYEVTLDEEGVDLGLRVRNAAATGATSEEDLEEL